MVALQLQRRLMFASGYMMLILFLASALCGVIALQSNAFYDEAFGFRSVFVSFYVSSIVREDCLKIYMR